jgi:hypothetical protein
MIPEEDLPPASEDESEVIADLRRKLSVSERARGEAEGRMEFAMAKLEVVSAYSIPVSCISLLCVFPRR